MRGLRNHTHINRTASHVMFIPLRSTSNHDLNWRQKAAMLAHITHSSQARSPQANDELLDAFWEARGVFDATQRRALVAAATEQAATGQVELLQGSPLPGVFNTWAPHQSQPQVVEVSRRLIALQTLLGDADTPSVVWMVVRYPALLTADFTTLTQRLFDMKLAAAGYCVDVVKVVVKQPALLLTDSWKLGAAHQRETALSTIDSKQSAMNWGSSSDAERPQDSSNIQAATGYMGHTSQEQTDEEKVQALLEAWSFGLSNDGDLEWDTRCQQLAVYVSVHGDASAGYRDEDDLDLSRWARKQRSEHRCGSLSPTKLQQLNTLGFCYTEDEADWTRWFTSLATFQRTEGHCSPIPLVQGTDLYLMNWVGIQRIARRSRVLSEERIYRLSGLGFDWDGSDPLS